MRLVRRTCLMLFLFALLPYTHILAQGCIGDVSLITPAPQSSDVALLPEIVLETNMDIVPGSVSFSSPYCATTTSTCVVTVMLLPQDVYENVSQASWKAYARSVTCQTTGPRQITIRTDVSGGLNYGTEYAILVRQLAVTNSIVPCSDVFDKDFSNAFTTLHEPSQLAGSSLDGGRGIGCSENILAQFLGQVETLNPAGGPLIELHQVIATTATNTTLQTTSLNISLSLDPDGKTVVIDPAADLNPGEHYVLDVNADYLTGDTRHSVSIPFTVRRFATVRYTFATLVTTPTITQGNLVHRMDVEYAAYFGETLNIWSPPRIGNLYLKEWHSSDLAYHQSTNPYVPVLATCSDDQVISLTAVYDALPVDQFQIMHSTMGSVEVLNATSHTIGGGSDTYGIHMDPAGDVKPLIISAVPQPGFVFDHWECLDDPQIHNSRLPTLRMRPRPPYMNNVPLITSLTPVFTSRKKDCSTAELEVEVIWYGRVDPGYVLEQMINIPGMTWSETSENHLKGTLSVSRLTPPAITSISLTASINGPYIDCFEFGGYYLVNSNEKGGRLYNLSALADNFSVTSLYPDTPEKICEDKLVIYFTQKLYYVDVSIAMEDGSPLPGPRNAEIIKKSIPGEEYKAPTFNGSLSRTYHYEFYCGEEARFEPLVTNEHNSNAYDYGQWSSANGNRATTVISSDPELIVFDVNQNEKLLYEVAGNFRLVKIGYYHTDKSDEITWKNVDGNEDVWTNDYAAVIALTEDIPGVAAQDLPNSGSGLHRTYPKVAFQFSDPVDPATLTGATMYAKDNNGGNRPDNKSDVVYKADVNSTVELLGSGKEVHFSLFEGSTYCCHMNRLKFYLNNGIESASGAPLSNAPTYGLAGKTEMPGLYGHVVEFELAFWQGISENCIVLWPAGWYKTPDVVIMGIHAHAQESELFGSNIDYNNEDLRFKPGTDHYHNLEPYISKSLNTDVFKISRLSPQSVVSHGWVFMDRGNSELDDKYGEILSDAVDGVTEFFNTSVLAGKTPELKLAQTLATSMAKFMLTAGLKCKDRIMCEWPVEHYKHNNWGMDHLYQRKVVIYNNSAKGIPFTFIYAIGDILN